MESAIIAFAYLSSLAIIALFTLTTICFFLNKKHGGKKGFFKYFVWYIKKF